MRMYIKLLLLILVLLMLLVIIVLVSFAAWVTCSIFRYAFPFLMHNVYSISMFAFSQMLKRAPIMFLA